MSGKYFGSFTDRDSVAKEFEQGVGSRWEDKNPFIPLADFPTEDEILLASYDTPPYEGYAYVLFRAPDGKLLEVEGSHCSCNGLEGQWSPAPVTPESLALRVKTWDAGGYGGAAFDENAKAVYREVVAGLLAGRA